MIPILIDGAVKRYNYCYLNVHLKLKKKKKHYLNNTRITMQSELLLFFKLPSQLKEDKDLN